MAAPALEAIDLGKRYALVGRSAHPHLRHEFAGLLGRLTGAAPSGPPANEHWAIRHAGFSVAPGEVVGVVGRNGAGKSTLLKILSRITPPSEGEVTIRGRLASLLEVGTGFHPDFTGRENIFVNGAILGMTRGEIASRFDEIVAFAEIERFLDMPVKRYSSGMYLRLAFAVAAHLRPEILLVDEVLAVGDLAFQERCLGKMQDAATNHGRTVLFVSHNLAAVRRLCGRCMLIEGGRLVLDGPTDEVLRRYVEGSLQKVRAGELDSFRARRGAPAGALRIERLEVLGGRPGAEGLPVFSSGEDVGLRLAIRAASGVRGATVAIRIVRSGGELATVVNSMDRAFALDCAPPGATLRCSLRGIPLTPGTYQLDVSLFQVGGLSEAYDALQGVPSFAVSDVPATGGQFPERGFGAFHWDPVEWGLEPFPDPGCEPGGAPS